MKRKRYSILVLELCLGLLIVTPGGLYPAGAGLKTVQRDPKIYTIFWGAGWAKDSGRVAAALNDMISSLPGTAWNEDLGQYGINDDVQVEGSWTDTAPNSALYPNGSYAKEIERAIAANSNWVWSFDTQFVILVEPGAVLNGLLATDTGVPKVEGFHSLINGALPVVYDVVSDTSNPEKAIVLLSHEYAEAATDPNRSSGWRFSPQGEEVADKCEGAHLDRIGQYQLAAIWDEHDKRCF